MNTKSLLSPDVRSTLVASAMKISAEQDAELGMTDDPTPASFYESLDDDLLRSLADDFSDEENEERERNSDWIEEMEEARKEADRVAGIPEKPRGPSPFDEFASPDHRTADQRAGLE